MNRSQSSLSAFISEANQTEPAKKVALSQWLYIEKKIMSTKIRKLTQPLTMQVEIMNFDPLSVISN